jgi:hypothetical protein
MKKKRARLAVEVFRGARGCIVENCGEPAIADGWCRRHLGGRVNNVRADEAPKTKKGSLKTETEGFT